MPLWKWSRTAATNSTADSTINWAEGQAPSSVNDSARAMMAAVAAYRDDIAGAITTGGTSTAYTVTSYSVFDSLAHMDGAMIAFTPHATNGATVTLNVDGLGAKPLRLSPSGDELPAGTLILGSPYIATYNNSNTEFYLQAMTPSLYTIPLGALMPFIGTTAPNSKFALPYGQAISRTTYATLFTLTSTTFGVGDGSTTFNIPDLRGRVACGADNIGGSAANRVTNAGSGITGTTLGATGGAQNVTLASGNIPTLSFSGTTGNDSPDHSHVAGVAGGTQYQTSGLGGTPVVASLSSWSTGGASTRHSHSFSGSVGTGSPTAAVTMPPTIITNYLLRIL